MVIKTSCRNCNNYKFDNLFSLGNLFYTGKFPSEKKHKIPKGKISLVKCKSCQLVQLDRKFNPKYLYNKDYGYRSTGISKKLTKLAKLKKNDFVLDIASNDATLLNSYKTYGIKKIGIDPILNKFKKFYKKIDYKIANFFSLEAIQEKKIKNKFKIITACAVFYDIDKPNKFLKDVSQLIDQDTGVFYLEFQDLLSIIKNNLFDTICHEHLEYYSLKVAKNMTEKNNMKIIDIYKNDINGGSLSLYIAHVNSKFKTVDKNINKILVEEKKFKLNEKKTYINFYNKINNIKKKLLKILINLKKNNKIIHGYGASTKGNVLLQYFNINHNLIDYIADRNPAKNNLYTPGTKIKIITEEKSRKYKPDFYLVLPWHFKKEILIREKKIIKRGSKFIFPLPNLKII
jgi:hypothetical protein